MAGQSWSINIVPSDKGVQFDPDVYGCSPGAPLQAQKGDLVSWNNQTENSITITISGQTLTASSWSSTTAYQVQTVGTITYTCEGGGGSITGSLIAS